MVPVSLQIAVDRGGERETADVELSVFVEQRSLDILLNDVGPFEPVDSCVLNQALNVLKILAHSDAAAPVGVLAWLYDPELLAKLRDAVEDGLAARLEGLFEELLKLEVGGVVQAVLNVESERDLLMVFFAQSLIVNFHVVVNGLLVAEVVVVLHFGVRQQVVGGQVFFFLLFLFVLLALRELGSLGVGVLVLVLEIKLGISVAQRGQLVLVWRIYQILFGGIALLVRCLGGHLGVKVTPSRLAPLFVLGVALLFLLLPRLDASKDLVAFPLSPNEVVVLPIVVVTHGPPESRLESCAHDARVVSAPDVKLVRGERSCGEDGLFDAVGF